MPDHVLDRPSVEPTVFAVHGLPTAGADPFDDLCQIRDALGADGNHWRAYRWSGSAQTTRREALEPIHHLTNGDFCETYVPPFTKWCHEEFGKIDAAGRVVLLSYSGGALIVMAWLQLHATDEQLQKLAIVFCIAGPHRFREGAGDMVLPRLPHHAIQVRETSLNAETIARKLRQWRLVVLLAEDDQTVPRWNASFVGTPERLSLRHVDEHVIGGTDHITLPQDVTTCEYLRGRFAGA